MKMFLDIKNIDDLFDDYWGLAEEISDKAVDEIYKNMGFTATGSNKGIYIHFNIFGKEKQIKLSEILIDKDIEITCIVINKDD